MAYHDRDYYRPRGFGGFSFMPTVIKNLLIINGVVFFLQVILGNISFGGVPGEYLITKWFALNPIVNANPNYPSNFWFWQVITYQFMHADFFHILFNMFMLWMFGMELENIWGSKKFLTFYLACGVGAALFQLFLAPALSGAVGPTIGASGAVYGVMVAFAMFFPDRYIYIYFLLPVKAKYLIAFLILIEFMSVGDLSFVAHLAHLGGAVTGVLFVLSDKKFNFNFERMFNSLKNIGGGSSGSSRSTGSSQNRGAFRRPPKFSEGDVEEVEYREINKEGETRKVKVTQEEIDAILDKISKSGYQNLTEREKRILFEASKDN